MFVWLAIVSLFADVRISSVTTKGKIVIENDFLVSSKGFRVYSKQNNTSLLYDYSRQKYYVVDYNKQTVQIYSKKDLYVNGKKALSQQHKIKKALKDKGFLMEEIIDAHLQNLNYLVRPDKALIKKAKDDSQRFRYNAYKNKKMIKSIWLRSAKSVGLNKNDLSLVNNALKSLLFFQYSSGQNSIYSVEDMYYKILRKKPNLIYDESVVYEFDLRYPTKTKVKAIKKVKYSKFEYNYPKQFKKIIVQ